MPKEYILKSPSTNDAAPTFVQKVMSWAKATNQLHGLLAGVLADGTVNESEAGFVHKWAKNHLPPGKDPLVDALIDRIDRVFSDGKVSPEELIELREMFASYTGDNESKKPTPLPLCAPAPELKFTGQCYCFTGTFAAGQRTWCQEQVERRGGRCVNSMTNGVTVLVIGSQISAAWANQSYGTKIMTAMNLRDSFDSGGGKRRLPAIVAEDHWLSEVDRHDTASSRLGLG